MPGELNLTVSLNRPQFPATGEDQLGYVFMEAQPTEVAPAAAATPLNLTLVLDRSGSMAGRKIADLKQAAKLTIDRMGPQDVVSIVIFDDKVDVVAPSQPVTNKLALMALIDAIDERGGTQISLGMQTGLQQLQQAHGAGRVSRMILLTDGETWEDEPQCRHLAGQAGGMGIPISALGLGDEWNQNLLTDIAGNSGGNWDYVDTPDKILTAFQFVVASMQGTVLSNANLVLRLVSGVRPRQAWRVAPLIDKLGQRVLSDRDIQVSLGDMQREGQSVLVELVFPARPAGVYRMAQAEVSYDVPGSGLAGEKAQSDVMVTFTADPMTAQQVNGRVMNVVEKVSAFKLMTRALDESEAADAAVRTRRLRAAATQLLDMGEQGLAQQALEAAEQMDAGQQLAPSVTKKLVSSTRKIDMSDLMAGGG